MARELTEQRALPEASALSFEERLGLLADRELTERSNRRLALKLRQAKLRHSATLEDLDTRAARGLEEPPGTPHQPFRNIKRLCRLRALLPLRVGVRWRRDNSTPSL